MHECQSKFCSSYSFNWPRIVLGYQKHIFYVKKEKQVAQVFLKETYPIYTICGFVCIYPKFREYTYSILKDCEGFFLVIDLVVVLWVTPVYPDNKLDNCN